MTDDTLVLWTKKDIDKQIRRAHQLVKHPENLDEYTAKEFMEHIILLGEAAKKLLAAAGEEPKIATALEMLKVGGKLHAEWREGMLPVTKRLWTEGKNGRKTQQVSANRRLGSGPEERGRGRTGKPGPDNDGPSPGSDGPLVAEPVGLADGD